MALWHNSIARYAIYALVLLRNGLREDTSIQAEMQEKIFRRSVVDPVINETCYYRWNVFLELDLILFLCALLFAVVLFKVCRRLSKRVLRRRRVAVTPRRPMVLSAKLHTGAPNAQTTLPLATSAEDSSIKTVRKRKSRRKSPAATEQNTLDEEDAASSENEGEWQTVNRKKSRIKKLQLDNAPNLEVDGNKECQNEVRPARPSACDSGLDSQFEAGGTPTSDVPTPLDRFIDSEPDHHNGDPSESQNERDAIQKKTFTKWVNKHLVKVNKEGK